MIQRTEKLNAKTSVLYFIIEDTRQKAAVLTAATENSVVAFSKKPARRRCEVGKKKEKETKKKEEIKKLKRKGGQRIRLWRICLFYLSRQAENITKTKFGEYKLEACNLEVRLGQISHVAVLLFFLKRTKIKNGGYRSFLSRITNV